MSKRNQIIIAVVAVALAVGGYWQLALAPKRQEAAKLDKDIAKKRSELNDTQALLSTYRKARDDYRVNYATLVRLGKAVPQDDDTRSLVVQLDAAAHRSGVDFRTVSVGGSSGAAAAPTPTGGAASATTPPPGAVSVDAAGMSAMPFTFSFRGSFKDLSGFFARLQRFVNVRNSRMNVTGRLLRVESIQLKPDPNVGFPEIRADVGASSYLLSGTEGLTAGGTPAGPAAGGAAAGAKPTSGGATPASTTATVTGATP